MLQCFRDDSDFTPRRMEGGMSDEPDREVTAHDQADINAFSRLNLRFHELEDEIKFRKEELVNLQDASNEVMMLMDDEELVKFNVGEAYADVSQDDAQGMLSRMTTEHETAVGRLGEELQSVAEQMKHLKARLTAKFGKSINLDEDEP